MLMQFTLFLYTEVFTCFASCWRGAPLLQVRFSFFTVFLATWWWSSLYKQIIWSTGTNLVPRVSHLSTTLSPAPGAGRWETLETRLPPVLETTDNDFVVSPRFFHTDEGFLSSPSIGWVLLNIFLDFSLFGRIRDFAVVEISVRVKDPLCKYSAVFGKLFHWFTGGSFGDWSRNLRTSSLKSSGVVIRGHYCEHVLPNSDHNLIETFRFGLWFALREH